MRIRTPVTITETWKTIPGFLFYEASSLGRIKALSKEVRFGTQFRITPEIIKKPQPHSSGYLQMVLSEETGKKINCYVHRLVADTFIGNPFGLEVNHKDCDKHNNIIKNLELVTRSENKKHADKNNRGAGTQRLTRDQILEIRSMYDLGYKSSVIARQFGIKPGHVNKIGKRIAWPDS